MFEQTGPAKSAHGMPIDLKKESRNRAERKSKLCTLVQDILNPRKYTRAIPSEM